MSGKSRGARLRSPARRSRPQTRLRISGPSDLLAVVPYLIGFHPRESLVVILVRSGQVVVTARMDLPPREAGDLLARQWIELADQHEAPGMVLVAYSCDRARAEELLGILVDRVPGERLAEVLYVAQDRYFSLLCDGPCCPVEGTLFDHSTHPLAAEAVYAGLAIQPDRASLAALVAGPPEAEHARLGALADAELAELDLIDGPPGAARTLRETIDQALHDPGGLRERGCLRLALLVTDVHLRDLAWAQFSAENAEDQVAVWQEVVIRVPPTLAAAPLCLLGMAAWISGQGALLNVCCERLAVVAPAYSMARLLEAISSQALPPSAWTRLGGRLQAQLQAELNLLAG